MPMELLRKLSRAGVEPADEPVNSPARFEPIAQCGSVTGIKKRLSENERIDEDVRFSPFQLFGRVSPDKLDELAKLVRAHQTTPGVWIQLGVGSQEEPPKGVFSRLVKRFSKPPVPKDRLLSLVVMGLPQQNKDILRKSWLALKGR